MDIPTLAVALASLAQPSQHARLIQLRAPVEGLVVERFHGQEAVCGATRCRSRAWPPRRFSMPRRCWSSHWTCSCARPTARNATGRACAPKWRNWAATAAWPATG